DLTPQPTRKISLSRPCPLILLKQIERCRTLSGVPNMLLGSFALTIVVGIMATVYIALLAVVVFLQQRYARAHRRDHSLPAREHWRGANHPPSVDVIVPCFNEDPP